MVGNERGGRKEAMGIWGWKIETLELGKSSTGISLSNLERVIGLKLRYSSEEVRTLLND